MSHIQNKAPKPGIQSLLPLFVIASAMVTCGAYLYVWTHDLSDQESSFYTTVVTAFSMPFGVAVTLIWWLFHSALSNAATKIGQYARPRLTRLRRSEVYHVAMLVVWSCVAAFTSSLYLTLAAAVMIVLTLLNLLKLIRE